MSIVGWQTKAILHSSLSRWPSRRRYHSKPHRDWQQRQPIDGIQNTHSCWLFDCLFNRAGWVIWFVQRIFMRVFLFFSHQTYTNFHHPLNAQYRLLFVAKHNQRIVVHAVFVPGAGTKWQQIRHFDVADIRVPTRCHRLWIEHTGQSNYASAKADTMHYNNADTTVALPREALGGRQMFSFVLFSLISIYALNSAHKTMAQNTFRRNCNRRWVRLHCIGLLCAGKHTYTHLFFYYTNIAFLIWWI